jgi:hypothetical protein
MNPCHQVSGSLPVEVARRQDGELLKTEWANGLAAKRRPRRFRHIAVPET